MQRNEVECRIFTALEKLSGSACLLEVLAERAVWDGGIEKLFQGLFLWAFNGLVQHLPYYYLVPEIGMGSKIKTLDYIVFESRDDVDRKVSLAKSQKSKLALLPLASGLIEVKDVCSLPELSNDLPKLREAARVATAAGDKDRFLYEMILLREGPTFRNGAWKKQDSGWDEEAESKCWNHLSLQGVCRDTSRIGAHLLFENKSPVCDTTVFTSLSVLVVSVPIDS
jgi:hypothetical protein